MKHFGDITKLNGYDLPIVDVITGGSPCQDLSVAGKRAGLAGERSGLFMEQIRIVKEMREKDERDNGRTGFLIRPRYMVWENVPGAFSSGKPRGADFAAVIEEIIKVAEPDANLCVRVPDNGWTKSGCYYSSDGRWSLAWTVHNAAEWGVPQRRVRISLVADFGGLSASEILFERKGMSWNPGPSGETWKEASGTVGESVESTSESITIDPKQISLVTQEETAATLGANAYKEPQAVLRLQENSESCVYDSERRHGYECLGDTCCTVQGFWGTGGNNVPLVQNWDGSEISTTLTSRNAGGNQRMPDKGSFTGVCISIGNGQYQSLGTPSDELARTLDTMHDAQAIMLSNTTSIVRRLTPLECERLQGFPDGWTDIGDWIDTKGKKHKGDADSPRYKALGNSIALPFWQYLARRICAQYERPITMGSLFDGIGGFPLVFERCGAKAVWASEIEEFPIAVTKYHFPEKE